MARRELTEEEQRMVVGAAANSGVDTGETIVGWDPETDVISVASLIPRPGSEHYDAYRDHLDNLGEAHRGET